MTGRLDGLTILRFARAYEQGGGVEGHLADLNRALGRRNRLTTIQMQLAVDPARLAPTEQVLGAGRLITVPLLERGEALALTRASRLKSRLLDILLPTDRLNTLAMRQLSKWRKVPRRPGCAVDAGSRAAALLRQYPVDLVVLHACGGADASEIIDVAAAAGTPVVIVHHFSNARLGDLSVRQQVSRVHGVAGASAVGVPRYLRGAFRNLSDSVDTEFYSRANATPLDVDTADGLIYAPGRLTPDKGQTAVIDVAYRLKQRGLAVKVVFAGRADVPDFEAHLRRLVAERGLSGAVTFLGALSLESYRDWYGPATVMVMPTRHSEGMPRTLIEAQSMQVPPVVYDIGGTSEGVRHGHTGFVINIGDIEAMTTAVESLLRQPALQRTMGEEGRRFVVNSFSPAALAARHEEFYTDALATRASLRSR
ncbi:glycosyltransferase family 4 protein [Luteitalea sp.]|uniref:glycosyltransferase family 4 protein n=1 Tax=Luteitalea sp. TaxID=2004800 RepID=UPI0025BFE0ED|nr:glycosyltransferase family 4 protein [Luteitalea sp.]